MSLGLPINNEELESNESKSKLKSIATPKILRVEYSGSVTLDNVAKSFQLHLQLSNNSSDAQANA